MRESDVPIVQGVAVKSLKSRIGIEWDMALEEMLAEPISPTLESKRIPWKRRSLFNADSDIDTSLAKQTERQIQGPQIRAKEKSIRTRQVAVAHLISSPLSPRKPALKLKSVSTDTAVRPKSSLRDKREVENVIHKMQQRSHNRGMTRQGRKFTRHIVAREYDIKVLRSVMGLFQDPNV
jgi:hypothetical protein